MDMQARNGWWIIGALLGAVFAAQQSTLIAAILLASGAYLALRAGYQSWSGSPLPMRKVKETYWRGRRIELPRSNTSGRSKAGLPDLSTALYLLLGSALAVSAITLLLNGVGRS